MKPDDKAAEKGYSHSGPNCSSNHHYLKQVIIVRGALKS